MRFAPGSHFSEHGHDGGEEFIVLDGTFSDHTGHFHAGSYVRNPVGFVHTPYTEPGCTILVKLRQFQPDDRVQLRIDSTTAAWTPPDAEGHRWLELHRHGTEHVRLCELSADAAPLTLSDAGGTEVLLLAGAAEHDGATLTAPYWLRLPAGEPCTIATTGGCRLWVKQGHFPG